MSNLPTRGDLIAMCNRMIGRGVPCKQDSLEAVLIARAYLAIQDKTFDYEGAPLPDAPSWETARTLDALWHRVDDNMYADEQDNDRRWYNSAMRDVKGLIEDMGGMCREDRAKEHGQFGVGS